MGKPPTQNTGVSANPVVNTVVIESSTGSTYDTYANNGAEVVIDYYRTQAADSVAPTSGGLSVEDQILSDYNTLGQPLSPVNFSWGQELDNALKSVEDVTNIRFNENASVTAETDMTFTVSGANPAASLGGPVAGRPGFYPTGATVPPLTFFESQFPITDTSGTVVGQGVSKSIGRAMFPGTTPSGSQFSGHVAVEGTDSMFQGATEPGAAHRRDSNLAHELGHAIGLSHPHGTNSAWTPNADFPSGFALNNNKYTAMSYNWATTQGLDASGNMVQADTFGQNVGLMAIDIAALQHKDGITDNNTGNTTYNMIDGSQITGPNANNTDSAGNRIALDIDGDDESQDLIDQAFRTGVANGGVWSGITNAMAEINRQTTTGTLNSGQETIGRAYKTIYDGQREAVVDSNGNPVLNTDGTPQYRIGNGGTDTISYAGAEQSAFINLNDAGLGNDNTNAEWLNQQREIKGSDRWDQLTVQTTDAAGNVTVTDASLQNEIDATVNDSTGTLRPDAFNAGGFFSRLYTTDANGQVTAIQDGGYSIANGSVIENAVGGDKDDTIIGNEHDNRLDGGKGADALFGGSGNDTFIAGDGNDTIVAGRGSNTVDGGADFDTVSYTDYFAPAPGPVTTPQTGFTIAIDGTDALVTKNISIPLLPETDTVTNVENIQGTSRDDVFTVENVSGNMYISGGQGTDSLQVTGNVANSFVLDPTDGTYPAGHPLAGQTYNGKISDGTNTIYYSDIDDASVTGFTPSPAPATAPSTSSNRAEMSIEDAAGTLMTDIPIVQAELDTKEAEGTITEEEASLARILDTPMAPTLLRSLQDGGVDTLDLTDRPMDTAMERVESLLDSSREAFEAHNLPTPDLNVGYEAREAQEQRESRSDDRLTDVSREDEVEYSYVM